MNERYRVTIHVALEVVLTLRKRVRITLYIKTQILCWCQHNLRNNLSGHPVFSKLVDLSICQHLLTWPNKWLWRAKRRRGGSWRCASPRSTPGPWCKWSRAPGPRTAIRRRRIYRVGPTTSLATVLVSLNDAVKFSTVIQGDHSCFFLG